MRERFEGLLRKALGRVFSVEGEDGHNRLCRFIKFVCHYGPGGTFCYADHRTLESGGSLCVYGTKCGRPTESYMRQMNEQIEWLHRVTDALEKSGGMVTMVMENPRFSVANLCTCGQPDNQRLPDHRPLCLYRVEHDFPVSVEEYREAVGLVH